MDKRKITIVVTLVLAAVGAAWAFGFIGGTDPAVAELQQMRDTMFSNRDLPEDQRRAQWQDFRQRMDGLSDEQRREFRRSGREQWQQFAQQRMDEFFGLPPAEQEKRLDEIIDRMTARQNERRQNPRDNDGARRDRGGRGDWGGRNMTDAQRDARRKQRLDRTSPKMRAQFSEFGRRLNERMEERGLPPMEGRGGRGWGGGFGRGGRV
jgi:hypothetical protein